MSLVIGASVHIKSPESLQIKAVRRRRTIYLTIKVGEPCGPGDNWRLALELTPGVALKLVGEVSAMLAALERGEVTRWQAASDVKESFGTGKA